MKGDTRKVTGEFDGHIPELNMKLKEYRDGLMKLLRYVKEILPSYINKENIRETAGFTKDDDYNFVVLELAKFAQKFLFVGHGMVEVKCEGVDYRIEVLDQSG